MQIPFSETFSVDHEESAFLYRGDLERMGLVPLAVHHFIDLKDPVQGGAVCKHHGAVCIPKLGKVPQPRAIACPGFIVSCRAPPPAAISEDDLSIVGLPSDAEQTITRVTSALLSLLPRSVLVESAGGLSEADRICRALSGEYHIAIVEMALGWWVEMERSRPAPQPRSIEREELQQGVESERANIRHPNSQLVHAYCTCAGAAQHHEHVHSRSRPHHQSARKHSGIGRDNRHSSPA